MHAMNDCLTLSQVLLAYYIVINFSNYKKQKDSNMIIL